MTSWASKQSTLVYQCLTPLMYMSLWCDRTNDWSADRSVVQSQQCCNYVTMGWNHVKEITNSRVSLCFCFKSTPFQMPTLLKANYRFNMQTNWTIYKCIKLLYAVKQPTVLKNLKSTEHYFRHMFTCVFNIKLTKGHRIWTMAIFPNKQQHSLSVGNIVWWSSISTQYLKGSHPPNRRWSNIWCTLYNLPASPSLNHWQGKQPQSDNTTTTHAASEEICQLQTWAQPWSEGSATSPGCFSSF